MQRLNGDFLPWNTLYMLNIYSKCFLPLPRISMEKYYLAVSILFTSEFVWKTGGRCTTDLMISVLKFYYPFLMNNILIITQNSGSLKIQNTKQL